METPYILPLSKPIKHGEKEITQLEFRELVANDLRGVPVAAMCFEHISLIASRLTSQPPSLIGQLSGSDFSAVSEVIFDFLGVSPQIGNK